MKTYLSPSYPTVDMYYILTNTLSCKHTHSHTKPHASGVKRHNSNKPFVCLVPSFGAKLFPKMSKRRRIYNN